MTTKPNPGADKATDEHPLEIYADSYERMARDKQGDGRVHCTSVAVDIRRQALAPVSGPRNFCPTCGKPTPAGSIHTCTPPLATYMDASTSLDAATDNLYGQAGGQPHWIDCPQSALVRMPMECLLFGVPKILQGIHA